MDYSLPGSCVCGILQARILEWVTISFSRGTSRPKDRTHVSCIAGRFSTVWTREAQFLIMLLQRITVNLTTFYLGKGYSFYHTDSILSFTTVIYIPSFFFPTKYWGHVLSGYSYIFPAFTQSFAYGRCSRYIKWFDCVYFWIDFTFIVMIHVLKTFIENSIITIINFISKED